MSDIEPGDHLDALVASLITPQPERSNEDRLREILLVWADDAVKAGLYPDERAALDALVANIVGDAEPHRSFVRVEDLPAHSMSIDVEWCRRLNADTIVEPETVAAVGLCRACSLYVPAHAWRGPGECHRSSDGRHVL